MLPRRLWALWLLALGAAASAAALALFLGLSWAGIVGGGALLAVAASAAHRLVGALVADSRDARQALARAKTIVAACRDAVIALDTAGAIREWNPAAEQIFGWKHEEVIGRELSDVLTIEALGELYRRRLQQYLRTKNLSELYDRLEVSAARRDGRQLVIELSLAIALTEGGNELTLFARDVTDAKRLELDLRQAQKLEAVGRLASGIAHELNTPVQFIGDSVHFLRTAFDELVGLLSKYRAAGSSPELAGAEATIDLPYLLANIPPAFDRTLDGLGRVSGIVKSTNEFAHPDQREMAPADLSRAVASTVTIARSEYKNVAELKTEFGELPPVRCHVGEVNQVVLNIVVNAAHAIADRVQGTSARGLITVRTLQEGDDAIISVSDTGTGIADPIRDKVFDPFFTTKEVGRGSGQGLFLARAVVVEKHGGSLTFESEVGVGTTFFIRLPIGGKAAKATKMSA